MKQISVIIPTFRNPKCLDICLKSLIENQVQENEIIVVVDGFTEESEQVIFKYHDKIKVIMSQDNQGMQTSLNYGVYNASNDLLLIINDDNVACANWDEIINEDLIYLDKTPDYGKLDKNTPKILTINQIEPVGPSIFNFYIKDFGKNPDEFRYKEFIDYSKKLNKDKTEFTRDGGIFPFVISKKHYMGVGGFDTLYPSPFICDWDFFLKLELMNADFFRTTNLNFYHFGSMATKKGVNGNKFSKSEQAAAEVFRYKWGMNPQLFENNSHRPKGQFIKGIKF